MRALIRKWALAAIVAGFGSGMVAWAQPSVFTYQGLLTSNGAPVNVPYDVMFAAYDDPVSGVAVSTAPALFRVPVSNGLFTAVVDFGSAAFNGSARWLEVSVRPSGGEAFTALRPRTPITSTPYAIRAANFSGTIAPSQIPPGSITGSMLATASIGRDQLAPGVVGPAQLAVPYQAGAISLASVGSPGQQFRSSRIERSVVFPVPFASTPSVTLAFDTPHVALANKGAPLAKAKSPTGFVASFPFGPVSVEVMPSAGTFDPMLKVVGGQPAVVGVAVVNSSIGLTYSHALDLFGQNWSAPVILAPGYLGVFGLATVAGRPALAYADFTGGISFLRSDDAAGDAWPVAIAAAPAEPGAYVSLVALAEINGTAAIVWAASDGLIRFRRALDAAGENWGPVVKLFSGIASATGLDLAVVDGRPAVALLSPVAQRVQFVRANDGDGATWPAGITVVPDPVPSSPWNGPYTGARFFEYSGRPAIGYVESQGINHPEKRVMYVLANEPAGSTWGSPFAADVFRTVQTLVFDFATVGTLPAMAVAERTKVSYAGAIDFGGTIGFGTPEEVEPATSHPSLAAVQGQPAIAFVSDNAIRYIRANTVPPNSSVSWIAVAP